MSIDLTQETTIEEPKPETLAEGAAPETDQVEVSAEAGEPEDPEC